MLFSKKEVDRIQITQLKLPIGVNDHFVEGKFKVRRKVKLNAMGSQVTSNIDSIIPDYRVRTEAGMNEFET